MSQRYIGRLMPDMDVCDMNGDKIGTVAHVYRHQFAPAGAMERQGSSDQQEIIEVKTGFMGLGKRLYIPASAIHDNTQDCLFLSEPRDVLDQVGWHNWDVKPPYLDSHP